MKSISSRFLSRCRRLLTVDRGHFYAAMRRCSATTRGTITGVQLTSPPTERPAMPAL